MLFNKKPTKKKLRQYKRINIGGMRFTIRKLNPYTDFTAANMPQIFTSFMSNRKPNPDQKVPEATIRKGNEDMKNMISAGVVEPEIGKDVDIGDLLSDGAISLQLYTEILAHSLNKFRGLKGVFFSAKIKRILYTDYAKSLANLPTS